MTALSGGDERLDDGPSLLNSVLERPNAVADARRAPRSLDEIFPPRGDAGRSRQLQETWRAFAGEMAGAVRAAFDASRSPPEIAYAIGEIVHNYFRTRGATLTSYELRRLVAELLVQQDRQPDRGCEPRSAGPALVTFADEPGVSETPWTGGETGTPGPVVPDVVFEGPPSPLVSVAPRDPDAAQLAEVTARARARLVGDPQGRTPRAAASAAIDSALDEVLQGEPERRERLARLALSELCGSGPIDRLWADRSVRAVFVNGPTAIYVERNGVLEPSRETFRDQAHLQELVGRLVRRSSSGAAAFRLRDGSEGLVVFPPAAPSGPVLVLRRSEPGNATFERLIAGRMLDRPMADLLRIAARSRLNMRVIGPAGSGKTALLAALARDLDGTRVVTVARHRAFGWPSASKVELVVPAEGSFATLLAAAVQLQPVLLIIDPLRPGDAPALTDLLSLGGRGTVAAGEPQAMAQALQGAVDLVIRLGRPRDGLCRVVSMEDAAGARLFVYEEDGFHRRTTTPSFAGSVQKAGYGEALASVLR